jgi:hypothetical protein
MKRSLGKKKFFFVIFLTFERDTTNLRDTLVEDVKKKKINLAYYRVGWGIFILFFTF